MAGPVAGQQQTIWAINCQPGIKRDGTVIQGNNWTDGQWARWQRGLPRSIGGYQRVAQGFAGPVRGMQVYAINGTARVHSGSASLLELCVISPSGFGGGVANRTPGGFAASADNIWQFDVMFNSAVGANNSAIIAHAAPNLTDIDSSVETPVYIGDINGVAALTSIGQSVSGGVAVFHPYLMIFGTNGDVRWSDANQPTVFGTGDSGQARIMEGKILFGMVTRGGAYAPSGLLWGDTSLVRASFIGSPAIFRFDTASDQTSVLSSSGIVEYDGLYFWPGVDRFLLYNGTVREVPNNMNINWFFDNLNMAARQKVFATKIPRYGEIWWFYPRGSATECNDAIIYNVRENTWYDAGSAPGAARTAAYFAQVFTRPLMFNSTADNTGKYWLYKHETGADAVTNVSDAILSFVESADISYVADGPNLTGWAGLERNVEIINMEPDFIMTQDMTFTVTGEALAQGSPTVTTDFTFGPNTSILSVREQRRYMRLKFSSNAQGGAWQMGQPLIHLRPGDGRR
jgi:hypothetical protein